MPRSHNHERLVQSVDALADVLIGVSHAIHARPELAFEERFACHTLTQAAERDGLSVQTGVFTLPTAFEAKFGDETGPTVAILAEYDALPDIGHACGHNIIAPPHWERRCVGAHRRCAAWYGEIDWHAC